MDEDRFCRCPCCGVWFTSAQMLESPEIEPLGMSDSDDLGQGNLLYFNHLAPGCGSTFALPATRFAPFLTEPEMARDLMGEPGCQRHCTSIGDLAMCRAECRWAPYRRFMLQLRVRRNLPTL